MEGQALLLRGAWRPSATAIDSGLHSPRAPTRRGVVVTTSSQKQCAGMGHGPAWRTRPLVEVELVRW
jgi:hypothetical protein